MSYPKWVDAEMPTFGPCAFCGGPDSRHRVIDAIVERVKAGEAVESVAADYLKSVEFIERLARVHPQPRSR